MKTLAFSFTKIMVADLGASERFYCDVLDMKLVYRNVVPDGDYAQEQVVLSLTGTADSNTLVLSRYLRRPAPPPGAVWTGFVVSNAAAALAAVEKAGGKIVKPVQEEPAHGVKAGIVADPDGHMIELIQMLQTA